MLRNLQNNPRTRTFKSGKFNYMHLWQRRRERKSVTGIASHHSARKANVPSEWGPGTHTCPRALSQLLQASPMWVFQQAEHEKLPLFHETRLLNAGQRQQLAAYWRNWSLPTGGQTGQAPPSEGDLRYFFRVILTLHHFFALGAECRDWESQGRVSCRAVWTCVIFKLLIRRVGAIGLCIECRHG